MGTHQEGSVLKYEGCNFFRQRLILATVSGRTVKVSKIRSKDEEPGLREFEASFIRLLDEITNGSITSISRSGTTFQYTPGLLVGGSLTHECNPERSISYYLEPLLCLAPFTKHPLDITLTGVTNSQTDPSVDQIRYSSLPILKKFLGTDEGLELKILQRGAAPEGGGLVKFTCPCRQKLRPVQFLEPKKIKRIRGIAWSVRVSPTTPNRMVEAAKGILTTFVADIFITADSRKGKGSGKSPGFGITLVAETLSGAFLTAEACSNPKGSTDPPSVPEDIGKQAATLLLEEIYRGGCVDSTSQSLAALCMVLGPQDVSKILTGPLSPYTIQFLRHIRDFLQVMFKVDAAHQEGVGPDGEKLRQGGEDRVVLTCLGMGYSNISKRTA
ncbi:RNA 3'-terminal phosphate cyclase-like protein [Littorina saxatilis]|uniref:RNA 3'-terminal phosphate cyclase-like protein n=1 Tax=Littorina saxatilis TaxID=31220 RepID=UPI0038B6A487